MKGGPGWFPLLTSLKVNTELSGPNGEDCSFRNVWMGGGKEQKVQEPNLEFL